MINAISRKLTQLIEDFIPDAFVFALFLTLITLTLSLIFTETSLHTTVMHWGDGFFDLLSFAMQMVFILIMGMCLAQTPIFKKLTNRLVSLAKTPRHAFVITTVFSGIFCWLNWGLGLVIGGLICKKMVSKFPYIRYGSLLGLSYGGFLVWHGGLSGSIPLKMSSGGAVMSKLNLGSIPMSQTVFSNFNLTLTMMTLTFLVALSFLIPVLGTTRHEIENEEEYELLKGNKKRTPALKWEHSFWVVLGASVLIFYYVGSVLLIKGLTLDIVNLILIGLALFFHGNISKFMHSLNINMKNASGIIICFPFYAGIMSIISSTGLGENLTQSILSIATEKSFYVLTYLSAGLVNFFVPSGGGQWVVQGPVTLSAAQSLGLSIPKAALALSWGDAWTNMIQPFWAIPLLSLAGLKLKDIMPMCLLLFFSIGTLTSLYFYFGN